MRRSWLLWTSAVLLLAACSSSGESSSPSATRRSSTSAMVTSTTATPSSVDSTTSTTTRSTASVTEFRPVVGSQLCSSVPAQGPDDEITTTPGTPELILDQAGKECYDVGPAGADQDDLASAEATQVEGAWTVQLSPAPAAKGKLNNFFNTCFASRPNCAAQAPDAAEGEHGTVAIVRGDTVLFTWKIETQDLANAPFQLPGPFSEADATALVRVLDPGSTRVVPDGLTDPAELRFRPVLVASPCGATPSSAQSDGDAKEVTSHDGLTCYRLGPVAADGTALASARAAKGPSGPWLVTVKVRPGSSEQLNDLFNACFGGETACPDTGSGHGAVAVVFDDQVISAPTVAAPNVASRAFQITGSFTQADAEALARLLTA